MTPESWGKCLGCGAERSRENSSKLPSGLVVHIGCPGALGATEDRSSVSAIPPKEQGPAPAETPRPARRRIALVRPPPAEDRSSVPAPPPEEACAVCRKPGGTMLSVDGALLTHPDCIEPTKSPRRGRAPLTLMKTSAPAEDRSSVPTPGPGEVVFTTPRHPPEPVTEDRSSVTPEPALPPESAEPEKKAGGILRRRRPIGGIHPKQRQRLPTVLGTSKLSDEEREQNEQREVAQAQASARSTEQIRLAKQLPPFGYQGATERGPITHDPPRPEGTTLHVLGHNLVTRCGAFRLKGNVPHFSVEWTILSVRTKSQPNPDFCPGCTAPSDEPGRPAYLRPDQIEPVRQDRSGWPRAAADHLPSRGKP